jgi:sulfite dehydrogenase (cytochrome) subunit A
MVKFQLPFWNARTRVASMSDRNSVNRAALSRRKFLQRTGASALGGLVGGKIFSAVANEWTKLPFDNGDRALVRYPQKRPLLRLTSRPPQLETPFSVFNEGIITPNDAFFVRYHLANIPTSIDPDTFALEVKGKVNSALKLSLSDLKKFDPVEIIAVNQCSGNSRGFFTPRVGGGQLGNGAMGNARWRGVRLKDVLKKAGIASGAKQVTFDGLDKAPLEKIPDFVKSLDLDLALSDDVMLAYEMNGSDLPMLNGFPLRLVVPGYFGTYWVKHLSEINVIDDTFNGFWMNPAYRIPDNDCACTEPGGKMPDKTRPIGKFPVRSFITSLHDAEKIKSGQACSVRGIAFDGGSGIKQVSFSEDGGKTWRDAKLGKDFGKYSFREWTTPFTPRGVGHYELKCRATSHNGQTQPLEPLWNPPGYMRNVVETVKVTVAETI